MNQAIIGQYFKDYKKAKKELRRLSNKKEYIIIRSLRGSVLVNRKQLKSY